jgi:hypothetical protein
MHSLEIRLSFRDLFSISVWLAPRSLLQVSDLNFVYTYRTYGFINKLVSENCWIIVPACIWKLDIRPRYYCCKLVDAFVVTFLLAIANSAWILLPARVMNELASCFLLLFGVRHVNLCTANDKLLWYSVRILHFGHCPWIYDMPTRY